MDLDEFCKSIKEGYPEISGKADALYKDYWDTPVPMEFSSYSWFESLANALNERMRRKRPANDYVPVFEAISKQFGQGNPEIDKAIDVAFVENLFWQVIPRDAEPYWLVMPQNLKNLYVGFHGHEPL